MCRRSRLDPEAGRELLLREYCSTARAHCRTRAVVVRNSWNHRPGQRLNVQHDRQPGPVQHGFHFQFAQARRIVIDD